MRRRQQAEHPYGVGKPRAALQGKAGSRRRRGGLLRGGHAGRRGSLPALHAAAGREQSLITEAKGAKRTRTGDNAFGCRGCSLHSHGARAWRNCRWWGNGERFRLAVVKRACWCRSRLGGRSRRVASAAEAGPLDGRGGRPLRWRRGFVRSRSSLWEECCRAA